MGFADLDKPQGLKVLDDYLYDKSYIVGYTPTAADAAVYEAVGKAPEAKYVNALRWYSHIASYGAEIAKFEGEKKEASFYGPEIKAAAVAAADDEDDDDIDLFGSDDEEEDAEAARIREERLAAYNAKKAAKPKAAAKSMIILDVKPWDDETDMEALKTSVRSIEMDGLLWGTEKLMAIGYGIKKLQITCVVEDDKVGVDDLVDQITEFEDYVQSVDIAAFNKL